MLELDSDGWYGTGRFCVGQRESVIFFLDLKVLLVVHILIPLARLGILRLARCSFDSFNFYGVMRSILYNEALFWLLHASVTFVHHSVQSISSWHDFRLG